MMHGGDEKCVQFFFGKSEGKKLLGRPKRLWKDNIKIDLKWDQECGLVS
jgi:hypothetical protein